MSLIIFPNFVFLNLLLGLPSLKKLHVVIILNFLNVLFFRNYRTLLGIQYCLQRIPLKSFFTFYNKLNKLLDKHVLLPTLSKCKSKQLAKPWITKGLRKAIKIENELLSSGCRERCRLKTFLVSVKEIIIVPILN